MNEQKKSLSLNVETLKQISESHLEQVEGGVGMSQYGPVCVTHYTWGSDTRCQ